MGQIDTYVGEIPGATGFNSGEIRTSITGEQVVGDAHARFYEAVRLGNCYGVAAQAGVTSQAGLSATTPVLSLYNPIGSGVNAVLWYAAVTQSVAPAAAMVVWLGVNAPATTAATGTLTTAHRNLLLGAGLGNKVTPLLAATLPAAPVGLTVLGVGFAAALTVNNQQNPIGGWLDGSIVIGPGTAVSFQTSTASGTSGLFGEFKWEEAVIRS